MNTESSTARPRRSRRARGRRDTTTETSTPSSIASAVASTATRQELASAVVTGTSSALPRPVVVRSR